MTKGVTVRKVWNRNETQIEGGVTAQLRLLTYRAYEEETVLSVLSQVALSLEPNTTGGTTGNLAGWARIGILRYGQQAQLVEVNEAWNRDPESDFAATSAGHHLSIDDDRDVGETWAFVPFAIGSSTGTGENMLLTLAPKTKRKLARGDQMVVELHYSNSASSNAILAWSATGTAVIGN